MRSILVGSNQPLLQGHSSLQKAGQCRVHAPKETVPYCVLPGISDSGAAKTEQGQCLMHCGRHGAKPLTKHRQGSAACMTTYTLPSPKHRRLSNHNQARQPTPPPNVHADFLRQAALPGHKQWQS